MAFDVNDTMFPLDPLGPAFARVGLDPGLVPLWFARLLRDGFALAAIGQYRPFGEVAAETLRAFAPDRIGDEGVVAVLGAFRELEPHPDVEPALRHLHGAGVPAVTLTNGSEDLVVALLTRSGLDDLVHRTLSIDEVRRWKPAPEPYAWAAAQLGVEPGQLALVASHPWDCAGARAAGLVAAWINRAGTPWPAFFDPPHVTGNDLTQMIRALLADG